MANQQEQAIVPFAGKWKETIVKPNGVEMVPEPCGTNEEQTRWEDELVIPFSIADNVFAFGGPFPNEVTLKPHIPEFFPMRKICEPQIFSTDPFNFTFIREPHNMWRYASNCENPMYIKWLDRVEKDWGDYWRNLGIYDIIQISRYDPPYQHEMLTTALMFYERNTHTFQFPCEMMTLSLLDVAAIIGLRPGGETFDPSKSSKNTYFKLNEKTFYKFIQEHHDEGEVSAEEHVAFLTFWLALYIFCSKSLQVALMYIPLAIQIHEGAPIALECLLLGVLYESLGEFCDSLKKAKDGAPFSMSGPLWLQKLWLNATFTREMGLTIPTKYQAIVNNHSIKGVRLVVFAPSSNESDAQKLFIQYMKVFLNFNQFLPHYAPFVKREIGPAWLQDEFPAVNPDNADEVNELWEQYLHTTVLSCRIGSNSNHRILVGCQPNLVSRQFGLSQVYPKCLFQSEKNMVIGNEVSKALFDKYLDILGNIAYNVNPIDFNHS